MDLDILEHGGICRLLVYFLKHPEGIARTKYRGKPLQLSSNTAKRAHSILFDEGLIKSIAHKTKLIFTLTQKGKRAALKLQEIADIPNDVLD